MRRVPWIAAILIPVLAACGQVEPVLMHVTMPDCTYQGPDAIDEGIVGLSLSLNGLADSGAILAELTSGRTFGELETHLETVSTGLDDLPAWVDVVIDLRLSDTDGIEGVGDEARLRPGSYVLFCVDYPYDGTEPTVAPASTIDVGAA